MELLNQQDTVELASRYIGRIGQCMVGWVTPDTSIDVMRLPVSSTITGWHASGMKTVNSLCRLARGIGQDRRTS